MSFLSALRRKPDEDMYEDYEDDTYVDDHYTYEERTPSADLGSPGRTADPQRRRHADRAGHAEGIQGGL